MASFVAEKLKLVAMLKTVRWVTLFLGISNLGVILVARFFMVAAFPSCGPGKVLPIAAVAVVARVRIMSMVGTGVAQEATATTILSQTGESLVADAVIRHERRGRMQIGRHGKKV